MIKVIVAIVGMLATGFIVWRLLQWQGDATDEKGNILSDRSGKKPPADGSSSPGQ